MSRNEREILEGLDDDQVEAVTNPAEVVSVVAGPGSGKTRVLTSRVAYRVAETTAAGEHCLVVTFTRSAAAELKGRLRFSKPAAGVEAGTLHSIAWTMVKRFYADSSLSAPTLVEGNELRLRVARKLFGPSWRPEDAPPDERAEAESAYRREKQRRHVVDFDDVIVKCRDLLVENARFAQAERWRYRHLFVDELQDLTPSQFDLITCIAGEDPDLFVVGDPNQAVYEWNGSDPLLIHRVAQVYPQSSCVTLTRNYRCSPAISKAADDFLRRFVDPGATLTASPEAGSGWAGSRHKPEVHAFPSEEAEAAGLATILRDAYARNVPWSRQAVLVRTNRRAETLSAHLTKRGVPVQVLTCHRAKGLEWELVAVAGAEDMPWQSAASDTARTERPPGSLHAAPYPPEEARLFYVAITRPARELYVTYAGDGHAPDFSQAVWESASGMQTAERVLQGAEAAEQARLAREALRRARGAAG